MRKLSVVACALLVALGLSATPAWSETITIQVSPNTLNLDSEGTWVTVHATIPLSVVKDVDLFVDGAEVTIASVYADARGDLVVKSHIEDVKAVVSTGDAVFTLSGDTEAGDFSGSDTIRVIDCKAK